MIKEKDQMKPKGPLMIEHRLIEKMIEVIRKIRENALKDNKIDKNAVETIVDFIKFYADRTHHGKEEDILFSALEQKGLSDEDRKLMNELVEEHKFGRKLTREIDEANEAILREPGKSIAKIIINFEMLIDFYPKHIEKEDKIFFPSTEKYFTESELDSMLMKFWEFDKEIIHQKYTNTVEKLEQLLI